MEYIKLKKSDKNISKTIKPGQRIKTDDKYFYKSNGYSKPGRPAVVIDTNKKNEIAVAKLTHSKKDSVNIPNYEKGESNFKAGQVYTRDDENKPITLKNKDKNGKTKFKLDNKAAKMSKKDVNYIKKTVLEDEKFGERNHRRLRNLKKRKDK